MEHPFLKVKRIFGYAKSLPSRKRGALPGTGEEHGASGAVIWTGQPADGGGSTDRLTRAQWAQIRPGAAGGSVQSPQRPRRSHLGGRNTREIGPESRGASAKLPR